MRIIISPAKQMKCDPEGPAPTAQPQLLARTATLHRWLLARPYPELRALLGCNDNLARRSYDELHRLDLGRGASPALLSYVGIQYRYMAPAVFSAGAWDYAQTRLRILSGFYGLLRPLDGVSPYRLEMGAPVKTDFCRSLYDFWGGALCAALTQGCRTVLDLASEEYSKAVRPHCPPGVRWVTARFGTLSEGKVVEKGVHVKMARGDMVRYLAENGLTQPEDAMGYTGLGYSYAPQHSTPDQLVFLQEG